MEDYHAHLTTLYEWGLKKNPKYSIRSIGATLLSATTGLRSFELYRLTIEKLSKALETGYFILESHEAKTHVERVIPIHPKIKDWIRTALELCKTKPFPESEINRWFKRAGSEIKLEQLRPFFIKISPMVCGMDEVIRIAITGHDEHIFTKEAEILNKQDVSEIYRKYTPQAIVDHYLSTVGRKFNPLPEGIQLSKLLDEW